MKKTLIGIALTVIALIILLIIWLVSTLVGSAGGVVEKTLNSDNVIYNYEWFKQQAEDLDAMEVKITLAEAVLKDHKEGLPKERVKWPVEDKEELSRLNSIVLGQKMHFEQMKADFKARSKMANRAIFKEDTKIIKWVEKTLGTNK